MGSIDAWWARLRTSVPHDVRGLWFGITDLEVNGGPGTHLYVAGCPSFDANDETAKWATEYVWWPDDRYFGLATAGVATEGHYTDVLDEVVALVKGLGPWDDVGIDGVAVGYDDGDFRLIWTVEARSS